MIEKHRMCGCVAVFDASRCYEKDGMSFVGNVCAHRAGIDFPGQFRNTEDQIKGTV
jgi:hypothetical protein